MINKKDPANNSTSSLPSVNQEHLKVAVIHDWLVVYGGAERVLEHILDCYPQADLFSLIDHVPEEQRHFMRGKKATTSFLQSFPGVGTHYSKLLPLMPLAIEQFDLSSYDLIISSSYCVAKGVLNGPNQTHVSYCHSPMRYAWDHYHEYLNEMDLQRGPKSWFARWQLHKIRTWDTRSSNTVDQFVANSKFVRARINKFYGRDAHLIYPPVETGLFTLKKDKEDFYVAAGRFVPFKRLDLAVDAFTGMPEKKLIMIGDGPDMAKLKSRAGPNIEFLGFQPPEIMRDYLSRAKAFVFPSEEDFGIVPVEAQACGTPVIAFGSGGALETVLNVDETRGPEASTGLWFARQTPESLAHAVDRFESIADQFDAQFISAHAGSFSPENFKQQFTDHVQETLDSRDYVPVKMAEEKGTVRLVSRNEADSFDAQQKPTKIETSRFGVPISLSGSQILKELIKTNQTQQVVSAVSERQLRYAGHNRDYQYLLNQSDVVVPYDEHTLQWLTEKEFDSVDLDSVEQTLLKNIEHQNVMVIYDSEAKLPSMLESKPYECIELPDTQTKSSILINRMKRNPIDVLILISTSTGSLEWLFENKDRLSSNIIITLPGTNNLTNSPTIRLLKDLVDSPSTDTHHTRWWKNQALDRVTNRSINLSLSIATLIILTPILLLVAIAIRLESKGPVLFKQTRVGLRGKTFTLYKFRSMYTDAEERLSNLKHQNESGGTGTFKMKHDPRVTRFGRYIRKLSIDELPQLLNVILGDMNLVGPRPALPSEVELYTHQERKRLQMTPGITCLWQISEKSELNFDDHVKLDLTYASRQGILEDISILAKTVPAVISGRGAY